MPSFPEERKEKEPKKRGAVSRGIRGRGMGVGMGVSGLVFALSMLPGKLGQLANSIMPAVFALQAFAMLAGSIGIVGAAIVALGVGLFVLNQSAKKSAEELVKAADLEAQARVGSAKSIQEFAEFSGRALPSAQEFSRNNRQLISASGEAVKRFSEFYLQQGNTATQVINAAAMKGPEAGTKAAAIDIAQRAAIFGLSPADIAANIKAASDLIGADQVELKAKVQEILAPNGQDITKEPLTVEARMNFLQQSSKENIQAINKEILNLSKVKLPKLSNFSPLSGDFNVGGIGMIRRGFDIGKRVLGGESLESAMTNMSYQELKQAAGYQESINKSYSGGFGSEIMGGLKQGARNILGYGYDADTLKAFKDIQGSVSSATMQLSIAFTQQKESLGLLNQQYRDGLITKEQYDAGLNASLENFDLLTEGSKNLVDELNKIDPQGDLAADALKGMGNEAFAALKKTNPELFKRITKSMEDLDGAAQIDIMMGYAKGSLTILDVARIPDILKEIDGKTVQAALKIIGESDLSEGAKGTLSSGMIKPQIEALDKQIAATSDVSDRAKLLEQRSLLAAQLKKAKEKEKEAAGIIPGGPLDSDNLDAGNVAKGVDKLTSAYDKELQRLDKKLNALKDINSELDRQNQYQMKQMDLINQASRAKISGDFLQAAQLQQQSMFEGAKFARESQEVQMERVKQIVQNRKDRLEGGGRIVQRDKDLLTNLKAGNYESIVPTPQTPTVGFNAGATGFAGSTTTVGGSMYTITMNISGENATDIANKVMQKLQVEQNKRNKSNKVR